MDIEGFQDIPEIRNELRELWQLVKSVENWSLQNINQFDPNNIPDNLHDVKTYIEIFSGYELMNEKKFNSAIKRMETLYSIVTDNFNFLQTTTFRENLCEKYSDVLMLWDRLNTKTALYKAMILDKRRKLAYYQETRQLFICELGSLTADFDYVYKKLSTPLIAYDFNTEHAFNEYNEVANLLKDKIVSIRKATDLANRLISINCSTAKQEMLQFYQRLNTSLLFLELHQENLKEFDNTKENTSILINLKAEITTFKDKSKAVLSDPTHTVDYKNVFDHYRSLNTLMKQRRASNNKEMQQLRDTTEKLIASMDSIDKKLDLLRSNQIICMDQIVEGQKQHDEIYKELQTCRNEICQINDEFKTVNNLVPLTREETKKMKTQLEESLEKTLKKSRTIREELELAAKEYLCHEVTEQLFDVFTDVETFLIKNGFKYDPYINATPGIWMLKTYTEFKTFLFRLFTIKPLTTLTTILATKLALRKTTLLEEAMQDSGRGNSGSTSIGDDFSIHFHQNPARSPEETAEVRLTQMHEKIDKMIKYVERSMDLFTTSIIMTASEPPIEMLEPFNFKSYIVSKSFTDIKEMLINWIHFQTGKLIDIEYFESLWKDGHLLSALVQSYSPHFEYRFEQHIPDDLRINRALMHLSSKHKLPLIINEKDLNCYLPLEENVTSFLLEVYYHFVCKDVLKCLKVMVVDIERHA